MPPAPVHMVVIVISAVLPTLVMMISNCSTNNCACNDGSTAVFVPGISGGYIYGRHRWHSYRQGQNWFDQKIS